MPHSIDIDTSVNVLSHVTHKYVESRKYEYVYK